MNTVEMQIQLVTKTQIPKNMFILYQGCVRKMHHGPCSMGQGSMDRQVTLDHDFQNTPLIVELGRKGHT